MSKSSRIQASVLRLLSDREPYSVQEMKAHLSVDGIADYTEGQFAGSINTLLRNGSIQKVDRGVYCLGTGSEIMKKCFVVSPIGDEGTETRKRADKMFKYIIGPVCSETGFDPVRVDRLNRSDLITQTIIDQLNNADLVIADISGHNPNSFYEMGYRAANGKPIIHIKEKNEKIPFDIAGIMAFDYDLGDLDSVEEIKNRLIRTIETMSFEDPADQTEEGEVQKETNSDIAKLVPLLYQIQDELSQLKQEVHNNNTETIQAIVRAAAPVVPVEDPNTALMKALIPEVLRNPNSLETFMQLAEMAKGNADRNKGKNANGK